MTPASRKQLSALAILFGQHGVTERDDRLRLCSDHARRHITTSVELSSREAAELAARLERLPRNGTVLRALEQLRRDDAAAGDRPGVIVCGPGQPTEHDQALIDGFADALAADRVRQWAGEQL